MDQYKCVISIGMRCFTEIYLKNMGLKKFSCVFDAMYCNNINNIINILENGFNYNDFIYTENINYLINLNNIYGYRTMHRYINYNNENLEYSYHNALLPHHNLNNIKDKTHFERCFERLKKIKNHNIKTLFCLFIHPDYDKHINNLFDIDYNNNEINKLRDYLVQNFNCKLLICKFKTTNDNYKWKIIYNETNLLFIHINNSSHIFDNNKSELNEIFGHLYVDKLQLLSYDDLNHLQ